MFITTQLDKTQAITHFLVYFVLMPLIVGAAIGIITAKFKPHSFKLILMITSIISVVFLTVVLLTLQSQAIPQLAIVIAIITITIMNVSALASQKFMSVKLTAKK
jgi:hypothetical protein